MKVIWGFDDPRTVQELWAWIEQYHNGQSKEYNRDSKKVFRKVEQVVHYFKPEKVGTKSGTKPFKRSPDAGDQIQAFVGAAILESLERAFLDRLMRFAHRWGQDTLDGHIEVQIPSRTLKSFNRQYAPILRDLIDAGYVSRPRLYGADIGRCTTYRVPNLETEKA